jgi:hypothetical protein
MAGRSCDEAAKRALQIANLLVEFGMNQSRYFFDSRNPIARSTTSRHRLNRLNGSLIGPRIPRTEIEVCLLSGPDFRIRAANSLS